MTSPLHLGVCALGSWPQLVRRAVLACLLGACSALASAEGKGQEPLQFCIADGPVPPFTAVDHEDLAQQALRQAARLQGREVVFVVRPWRRCFAETAEGTLHGMLPVAPVDANRRLLRFPEVNGQLDNSLTLDSMRVLVLRPRGSTANWDGQHFSGVQGPILYLAGIKVLDDYFSRAGLPADSSARGPEALGLMLLRKRSNMAVDLEARARRMIKAEPFRSGLELLPQPLFDFPVYLAISPALQTAQPDLAAQLWRDTTRLYRDKLAEDKASWAP